MFQNTYIKFQNYTQSEKQNIKSYHDKRIIFIIILFFDYQSTIKQKFITFFNNIRKKHRIVFNQQFSVIDLMKFVDKIKRLENNERKFKKKANASEISTIFRSKKTTSFFLSNFSRNRKTKTIKTINSNLMLTLFRLCHVYIAESSQNTRN